MLFAGIAWSGRGFDVAFLDPSGEAAAPPAHFPAGRLVDLTSRLHDLDEQRGHDLVCIVDSTNGMVDGGLLARGLRVHRADPWQLPQRPGFGSVAAETLARTGLERLPELARLVLAEGSLTGRSTDHARQAQASEHVLAAMVVEGRCMARGPEDGDKMVALTFDDGPNPPYTGRILDVLAGYGVPATFFCVGLHASGHREELARMAEAGHGIGNHTWSHPFLPDLSVAELREQLHRADEAIAQAGGARPVRLFRPPYGSGTAETFSWLGREEAATVVLWDVDTNDWAMPGSDAIAASVLDRARPGSIVLMHDGGGDRSQTVEALPRMIEGLLSRGFRLATVDDLRGVSGFPGAS